MKISETPWEVMRQRGWLRYVVLRNALPFGLPVGIGIPLLNFLALSPPNHDLFEQLAFSVPFFVVSWGAYGAFSWHRAEAKYRQSSKHGF